MPINPIKNCIVCGSKNIEAYGKFKDRLYSIPGEFNYSICQNCDTIFQNPFLSSEELSKYYPKEYISFNKENKKDGRNSGIQLLYNTYYSPSGKWYYKILFFPIKSLLRSMPKLKGARFLDVGCGDGKFLKYVKEAGMVPYGCDPFLEKPHKELNILNKDLLKSGFPDDYFDFITLNKVLEHLTNPYEILNECKRILKPKGLLLINIPNTSGLNFKLFGRNWVSLDPPRHTFLLNNKGIGILAKSSGMKIKKINYKSEPFTFIGSREYKKGETKLDNNKNLASVFLNALVMPYSLLMNFLKIGDQTEIILGK